MVWALFSLYPECAAGAISRTGGAITVNGLRGWRTVFRLGGAACRFRGEEVTELVTILLQDEIQPFTDQVRFLTAKMYRKLFHFGDFLAVNRVTVNNFPLEPFPNMEREGFHSLVPRPLHDNSYDIGTIGLR